MDQRTMSYLGSWSLRRLLSLVRRSSADEDCVIDADPFLPPPTNPTCRCFSYEEVDRATNGFHPADNVVGGGRYGEVYCRILDDGRAVAVKRLVASAGRGDRREEGEGLSDGARGSARAATCAIPTSPPSSASTLSSSSPREAEAHRGGGYVAGAPVPPQDIKASNIFLDAAYELWWTVALVFVALTGMQISDFGLAWWLPSEWTPSRPSRAPSGSGYFILNFQDIKIADTIN
ncbi:hypothetical protein ACQ4PT_009411 [Festuca glaucescens]